MKWFARISGVILSGSALGAFLYFWAQGKFAMAGYVVVGLYVVSYIGRVIYAVVIEKKTGKTPPDES